MRISCALVVLALALPFPAHAAGTPTVSSDPAEIDAWLSTWAEVGFLSGCLLVARGDEVLYEGCFGDANAELGVPNSPTTRFAIASVTKALQQILLARLVDAGALSLEDPLSRWIDDFPRADEISIEQVANHLAAIPHRVTEPPDEIEPRTAGDMVELVREQGLLGDPGVESVYSSAGYSVLARVLELAGDASWSELMQREVFDVAGMDHTVHPADRRLIPERASSYVWTPDGYRLTPPKDLSFLVGAGSLYSTPRDLFGFIRTLVDGGFGRTAQDCLGEGSLSSNGLTNGYRTFADYDAEADLSVILCANVITGALARLREDLPRVFAGEPVPEAEIPDVGAMVASGEDWSRYEGSYRLRPGRELGIRSAGTHLDVDGWMLLPMGTDTFFCVQDFGRVVFEYGEGGTVSGLLWGESEYRMPRVDAAGASGEESGGQESEEEETRTDDLSVFETDVLEVDQSFTDEARAEARRRLESLRQAADGMTAAEFELALAEIVTLANNGHTAVIPGRWSSVFNRLAVRFLIVDDGLYVADAVPGHEALIGKRVLAVDDRDLDTIRSTWARYCSGRSGHRDNALYLFLESPELLHAAGIAASPDNLTLRFEAGGTAEVGVTDAWPAPEGIWRWLPEARHLQLAGSGRIGGDPLYLQEPEAFFRLVELPDRNAVYVQFRANHDFAGGDLEEVANRALVRLRKIRPEAVIVDQRFNFGGNLNTTRDLMEGIPEVVGPEGRVVAIVSGRTFSAGIASLGYLKQAGGDRVVCIGTPIGDHLEFWAEGSPVRLPGSGTLVGIALERHNYRTGCPEDDCHGSIRRNPIRVDDLEPDLTPALSYEDVVAGRDPYLEAALEVLDRAGR